MIQAKRLGHVAFTTPDLAPAIEYYTQVIGLVLTSRDKQQAFLSTKLGQLAVELNVGTLERTVRLFDATTGTEHLA